MGKLGNLQVGKVSKCISGRGNNANVESKQQPRKPVNVPAAGCLPAHTGGKKPLELNHAVIISRGLFILTTYFQQTQKQSPECYDDIVAQSPGICTLISDGSSEELIKLQLQGPLLS